MDWKKTKSIFILTFLVLNLFLGYQLYQKNDINNIARLSEQPLEERLAINKIAYEDKIPKYKPEQTLISAQRYKFTEEEQELGSKDISLVEDESTDITLVYKLKKPMELPKKDTKDLIDELTKFLEENVTRGKEYKYYKWDNENNIIWFNQIYLEKPIFYNAANFEKLEGSNLDYKTPNGMIKFKLDDKGNLTEFTQTYLGIMRQGAYQEIITPKQALGRLLDTGDVEKGNKIKDITLGYYSLVGVGDLQVYAPTWFIETENGQFLVNATDSSIQVLTEKEE
ncbi:two-component system regulatory protein YycI [Fictibacillus nanhaiensis]|uniref:two-component system regulatory protein YycI n=1 Tax=Fictibacillus nanhaiensis TaxID=742169 RepID=UPI00203DA80C|nr:two-component system regulatory protein YycI [Fictibacillus nanhaiensis]MCM3731974.1 two-component system regulatory protein YycI [Fictibacillus nanhaiensis]